MLLLDPFDIAPRAKRHATAAWLLLGVAVVFALASAALFAQSWNDAKVAREELAAARKVLSSHARAESRLAEQREPADLVRARLELQRVLNLSWSGLFDILEGSTKAVESRVTVAALAPVRLRAQGVEIGILAATPDAMLLYLQTLQADRRVRQVQLVSQQAATVGPASVVRFQATLLLDRSASDGSLAAQSAHAAAGGMRE